MASGLALLALILGLSACAGETSTVPGQSAYVRYCASCHGNTGMGIPGLYPPLVGTDWATGDQERLIRITLGGMQGPMVVNGATYNNVMPPHNFFSDAETADVLTYIRNAWGNAADAVSATEVARVRALLPTGLQTVALLEQPLTAPAAGDDPIAKAEVPVVAVSGSAVYRQVCQACHQDDGQGLTGLFPPLAGADWVTGDTDRLIRIVLGGIQGEIEVAGTVYNGVMASQAHLSDAELSAVLTYVRQTWGNDAPAVEASEVEAIRGTMTRTTPWTVEELEAAGAN
ncbi:MAG: cytochrome c [Bacteroidota bacterium]